MNTRHPPRGERRNRGVTLIELMVGIAIGLIVVAAASAIYLYSKRSYNAVSENSQMEENGRFALDLITKYIQSAGFVMIDPTAPDAQMPLADKLDGCAFGFVNATAATSLADLACRTAAPAGVMPSASIVTRYETDAFASSAGKQQGFGCTNEAAASKQKFGVQSYEARAYVFISTISVQTPGGTKSMGQLSCVSDSTPVVDGVRGTASFQVQPLVPGIEQLSVGYVSSKGALVAKPTTAAAWQDIAAIELCVLARTIQTAGNDSGTQYTDCYGNSIASTPSESYRTLRTTVALRNTASL